MKTTSLLLSLPVLLWCSCASTTTSSSPVSGDSPIAQHLLLSRQPSGSASFLRDVFDWNVEEVARNQFWQVRDAGGRIVAGLVAVDTPSDGSAAAIWLISVLCPDFDATLERVAANGGSIQHGPVVVRGGIRTAVVADPEGAVFQIQDGDTGAGVNGESPWIWHVLGADSPKAAADWYAAVLGMDVKAGDQENRYELTRDGVALAGVSENLLVDAPSQWIPVLRVGNLADVLQRVNAAGGDVLLTAEDDVNVALIADALNAPILLQEVEVAP